MNETSSLPSLVIVSGLSGAGKTIAIHALEDMGFYCIDNLPLDLIENVVSYFIKQPGSHRRLALGLDVRSSSFVEKFREIRKDLEKKIRMSVLFLTANDDILATRFGTSRRRHPLDHEVGELIGAIRRESHRLKPLESCAEVVLDTSSWTPHQLARQVEYFYESELVGRSLNVSIISFGFKYGPLKMADSVFDVRFLKNPYFELKLRNKTGLDKEVSDFVFSDDRASCFLEKMLELHHFLLPNYYAEGKHYFRIGIGCTGGQHRSVAMSEKLAYKISSLGLKNTYVSVSHRDAQVK